MDDRHHYYICDLDSTAIDALAALLAMPPPYLSEDGVTSQVWLERQAEKIEALPKSLRCPTGRLQRLRIALSDKYGVHIGSHVPRTAVLCPTHKALNPWLMHRIFLHVADEVTIRLNRVNAYEGPLKTPEVRDMRNRLIGISSLWMTRSMFAMVYGADFPGEFTFPRVRGGCEVCILSVVGAHAQLLADLHANMLARSKRRHPRLMELVLAWVEMFGRENRDAVMVESNAVSRQLVAIRRVEHERRKERKSRRSGNGEGSSSTPAGGDRVKEKGKDKKRRLSSRHVGGRPAGAKMTKEGFPLPQKVPSREAPGGSENSYTPLTEAELLRHSSNRQEQEPSRGQASKPAWEAEYEQWLQSKDYAEYEPYYADMQQQDEGRGCGDHPAEADKNDYAAAYDYDFAASIYDYYARAVSQRGGSNYCGGDDDLDEQLHPAFRSTFMAPSAMPSPLVLKQDGSGKGKGKASADDARSWVSCTVHTTDEGDMRRRQNGGEDDVPRMPDIPGGYLKHAKSARFDGKSSRNDSSNNNKAMPTSYAASSVYSSHKPAAPRTPYVPARQGWSPGRDRDGRSAPAPAPTSSAGPASTVGRRPPPGEYTAMQEVLEQAFGMAAASPSRQPTPRRTALNPWQVEEDCAIATDWDSADEDEEPQRGQQRHRGSSRLDTDDATVHPDDSISCVARRPAPQPYRDERARRAPAQTTKRQGPTSEAGTSWAGLYRGLV